MFFSHEPHVSVPGTLLLPKSLKLQGSGWGPHPRGWSQGESDIHHHIWMPCAFSRFLSSVQDSFREVARLTLQQTESKEESPTVLFTQALKGPGDTALTTRTLSVKN